MNLENIKKNLSSYDEVSVSNYIAYLDKLSTEQKKEKDIWVPKNPWIKQESDLNLISHFEKVKKEGLEIDGKHITIQSTGLSYDYVAYKNKMLLAYPETKMFFSEVYIGDEFFFNNENGIITYRHTFENPFLKDTKKIVGLYCIIKNKRGEFMTFLNKEEIEKYRKSAKTDYIWAKWELEMMYKTIIKKAVKVHFNDVFTGLDETDNEQIDLGKPLSISLIVKQEIESINTIDDLKDYYQKNKNSQKATLKDFMSLLSSRKSEIMEAQNDNS